MWAMNSSLIIVLLYFLPVLYYFIVPYHLTFRQNTFSNIFSHRVSSKGPLWQTLKDTIKILMRLLVNVFYKFIKQGLKLTIIIWNNS